MSPNYIYTISHKHTHTHTYIYIYGSTYNTCMCVRFVSPLYVILYVIHSLYTTNIYASNTYTLFSTNTCTYIWFHYYIYMFSHMMLCPIRIYYSPLIDIYIWFHLYIYVLSYDVGRWEVITMKCCNIMCST